MNEDIVMNGKEVERWYVIRRAIAGEITRIAAGAQHPSPLPDCSRETSPYKFFRRERIYGMRSVWPSRKVVEEALFNSISRWLLTPNLCAKPEYVSPRCTR